jgi:hypothetical protein
MPFERRDYSRLAAQPQKKSESGHGGKSCDTLGSTCGIRPAVSKSLVEIPIVSHTRSLFAKAINGIVK